jgi:hypothetical protein
MQNAAGHVVHDNIRVDVYAMLPAGSHHAAKLSGIP